jgi:cyclopropane fatty-acyl-phospholipid synthase-like methyltransferase
MTRTIGERHDIDPVAVRAFFERRAARARSDAPLTAVLYQDQSPELAAERDRYERRHTLPMLRLEPHLSVLDVGCGIGRWAPDLLEHGVAYCGVDFSEELLEVAREAVRSPSARFVARSMTELDADDLGRPGGFDRVLMAGVLMYVNDDEVLRTLAGVERRAAPASLVYLRESTAVERRLTLDRHWSGDLASHYSAVYRTRDELVDLLEPTLLARGFRIAHEQDLYPDALNNRAETRQRIYLLERR